MHKPVITVVNQVDWNKIVIRTDKTNIYKQYVNTDKKVFNYTELLNFVLTFKFTHTLRNIAIIKLKTIDTLRS